MQHLYLASCRKGGECVLSNGEETVKVPVPVKYRSNSDGIITVYDTLDVDVNIKSIIHELTVVDKLLR